MRFKAATLKVSLINFKSNQDKSITNYISEVVLYVELFVQGALQNELFIAPFVECFKAVTPRRSPWQILTVLLIPLEIAFPLLFCVEEDFLEGAPRSALFIARFVKLFKAAILSKSY